LDETFLSSISKNIHKQINYSGKTQRNFFYALHLLVHPSLSLYVAKQDYKVKFNFLESIHLVNIPEGTNNEKVGNTWYIRVLEFKKQREWRARD
jgi:hypothetical protein